MSHHLAEMLDRVENEVNTEKKEQYQQQTVELILKIWEHRSSLNGNAYPLARFKGIIESLSVLSPEANVWEKNKLGTYESLAADSFSMAINLCRALFFVDFESLKSIKDNQVPPTVMSDEEQEMYDLLVSWAEEEMKFRTDNEIPIETDKSKQAVSFLSNYIDDLRNKLKSLKKELTKQ